MKKSLLCAVIAAGLILAPGAAHADGDPEPELTPNLTTYGEAWLDCGRGEWFVPVTRYYAVDGVLSVTHSSEILAPASTDHCPLSSVGTGDGIVWKVGI